MSEKVANDDVNNVAEQEVLNVESSEFKLFEEITSLPLELQRERMSDPETFKTVESQLKLFEAAKAGNVLTTGNKENSETTTDSSTSVVDDDSEVTITLKPSELGTYAKGRNVQDAIRELLKGKQEADKTINYLKNHKLNNLEKQLTHAQEERETLSAQLREYLTQKSTVEKPSEETTTIDDSEEIDVDAMLQADEADFFDPDTQKSLFKALKGMDKQLKALKSNPLKATPATSGDSVQEPKQQTPTVKPYRSAVNEIDEIREFQANPQFVDDYGTETDFTAINAGYTQFVYNMAQNLGIQAQDAQGSWTPQIQDAISKYFSDDQSPDAKNMRDRLSAAQVAPPLEVDKYFDIMSIRGIRSKYRDTNDNPISFEEAAQMYSAQRPPRANDSFATEQAKALERASANRKQFSVEANVGDSVNMNGVMGADINYLISQKPYKDHTVAERERLRSYLRENKVFTDEQIDKFYE